MKKILIIEDEKDIREALTDLLKFSGYNVLNAKNGKEGYEMILFENPDLILCDVNMPVFNGFELLRSLSQRFDWRSVPPFVFLSARVEISDIRQGMSLGADDYVIKPYDPKEILDVVKIRLEKRINIPIVEDRLYPTYI